MLEQIDLEKVITIAKSAGDEIMKIYQKDFLVDYQEDNSPLTEADLKSNEIICTALKELYPHIPILSEENKEVSYAERKTWKMFWLIDPIDGTKEFIKRNGEFTVNIALIEESIPVLGVVYAPALEEMYMAKRGFGAFKNGEKLPLLQNESPKELLNVVASKSHLSVETQLFIDSLKTKRVKQISKGSSLKLCMVAEGIADIYPRLAPTMEWDTAAAHAIVLEAGKEVIQFESKEALIYNKEDLLNPWFIVQ